MPETAARPVRVARWYRRFRLRFAGGHQVALLQNGAEFFPALIDAIVAARESILLETYIFHDDRTGRAVARALADAAARGVAVRLLIDGFGTRMLTGDVSALILASPVRVRVFRPFRTILGMRLRVLRRLHRKLCVIDGSRAFVGGINVLDDWFDPRHGPLEAPRLDFAVSLTGALVPRIEQAMIAAWEESAAHEAGHSPSSRASEGRAASPAPPSEAPQRASAGAPGDVPEGCRIDSPSALRQAGAGGMVIDPMPPWSDRCGPAAVTDSGVLQGVRAALALRDNVRNRRTIEQAYLRAIGAARREVLIACAYFLPGRRFRRALAAAVCRGVRVRLLLQGRIEYAVPHLGTQALYESLLAAGVEIIEYDPSFLHAKVAIADDWATVGSSNIDPVSLLLAREANVVLRSARFAALLRCRLEEAIDRGGKPVVLAQLQRQPLWRRAAAHVAWMLLRVGVAVSGRGLRY
jgi:cardiolipin synthase